MDTMEKLTLDFLQRSFSGSVILPESAEYEQACTVFARQGLPALIAGVTLSGGAGWMVREYGLTIDNMLSADIVIADGQLLTASADTNRDLFWAIRGGGGNFGIAIAFEFAAHPVGDVYFGSITLAAD